MRRSRAARTARRPRGQPATRDGATSSGRDACGMLPLPDGPCHAPVEIAMTSHDAPSADDARRHCQAIASAHYENFPTASFLLSSRARPAIAAIYAFARAADDFADEAEFEGRR